MLYYSLLPYALRFKKPARTSRGAYTEKKVWYIFLSHRPLTSLDCLHLLKNPQLWGQNEVGVGEIAPLYDLSCDYGDHFENTIMECLRLCFESVDNETSINFEVLRNYPSVLFGVETAWHSLHVHDGLSFFASGFSQGLSFIPINGLVWMSSLEEMQQQALTKIQLGFKCIKFKIGAMDWREELDVIQHIQSLYSKDQLQIRVDANGSFTMSNVFQVLERLHQLDVHSIEQPIKAGQWAEMHDICRNSPVPIGLDEELIGINRLEVKQELMASIRPQYIILKPTLHGGYSGIDEWIELAKAQGAGYWLTSALESNVGLNAIAQKAALLDGAERWQGLGTGQLFVENIEGLGLKLTGEELWFKP
jgi:o-succinylbenzoate synthase